MASKVDRLEQIIKKEISTIIQFEMKDHKIGFVTVTDVRLTNDLSLAKIYVNFLGGEQKNEAGLKILEKSKGFMRSSLAKKLTIRKVPELRFLIDTSLEEGNRIEQILRDINK